jgi:GAF domain-containing protein
VDETQYQEDEGPCLHAMRSGQTVVVTDQTTEDRWPGYDPRAVAAGVRSSCSVPLQVSGEFIGALNAYGTETHAFDDTAVAVAEDLAGYAGIVLNNAGLYFTAATHAEQMAEAMRSRAVIEQAKGILMGGRRCTADEAFQILARISQESQRKLRDVAAALVADAASGRN